MACPRCGSDRPELRLSSDNGRTHCGHGWHHYCNATDCERCNGKIRPEDIVARELRRDGISADLAYGDAHDILAALAAAGFVVRPLPDEEQRRLARRCVDEVERIGYPTVLERTMADLLAAAFLTEGPSA